MFFVLLVVFNLFFGSCIHDYKEVCYGRNVTLPFDFMPPLYNGSLYFSPNKGGPSKVLMENGMSKDPRLSLTCHSFDLRDLTEEDDGDFSITYDGENLIRIGTLKILDCADVTVKHYGSTYKHHVPTQADFLEYTPFHNLKQSKILWNRTNPELDGDTRGYVFNQVWHITVLTQKDNGYYNFRERSNGIVARLHLTVKEMTVTKYATESDFLFVEYPGTWGPWTVTFTPEGRRDSVPIISDRRIIQDDWFNGRIHVATDGIEITPVAGKDSGIMSFRDQDGNLIMNVEVEVEGSGEQRDRTFISVEGKQAFSHANTLPSNSAATGSEINIFYIVIAGLLIPAMIFCCCCCYCQDKCSKRGSPPQETAASPAVYHHGANEPAGPAYSAAPSCSTFSYQPVVSSVPKAPTATSFDPPAYQPVNIQINPAQPQVAPPEGQGSVPAPPLRSDVVSSESEPTFELKGVMFPSASPLTSDSTSCNVYTSDKLNFQ